MWWLTLPVIMCSSWLFAMWLILVRRRKAVAAVSGGLTEANHLAIAAGHAVMPEEDAADAGGERGVFPMVSVVVAVRNEEKQIGTLLGCLAGQDYPPELLEIIIVNDNSTDRTPIIASEFITGRGDSDISLRLVYNPFPGKKRAIRYGIEKASGEIIITTDADCTFGPGWVRRHALWYTLERHGKSGIGYIRHTERKPGQITSSGYVPDSGETDMLLAPVFQMPAGGFWSLFGVFEFAALQAITEATAVAGHPVMCNAANMSFRRNIYIKHADELHQELASGDDMFLLHAVMRGGGAVRHDGIRAAAVETAAAVRAAALLRQRARWASKTFRYRSPATLTLAAATVACNAAVTAAAVVAFISPAYVPLAASMYAIKIIPDYLLVAEEMKKQGTGMPVIPFILSEIIYPFYFMIVGVMSLFPGAGRFRGRDNG